MSARDDDADAISLTPSTTSRRGCRRHPHHQHHGHHHHFRHRRTPSTSSTASAGCRRSHSPGGSRYDTSMSPPRVVVERCCSALDDEVERYFYIQNRRSSGGGAAIVYGSHGSLSRLSRCNSMRRRRSHTSIVAPSIEVQHTPLPPRTFRAISPKPVSEGGARLLLTPSKLTVEAASSRCSSAMKCSSSDTSELPDYVYAPSPIKWHFPSDAEKMSNGSSSSGSVASADSQMAAKKQPDVKTVSIWRTDNDEANAIIFHHESEIVENCCRPPPPQDDETDSDTEYRCDEKLNNRIPSHPPALIEMSHRNSFPSANLTLYRISSDLRRFQKSSNFSHNTNNINMSSCGKLTNCEPSTSRSLVEQAANNLTDIFSRSLEQALLRSNTERDTKFINTTLPHCTDLIFRASPPLTHSAAVHSLARRYDKSPANISLTNQNRFTSYFNADRRQSVNVLLPATDIDAIQHSPTSSDEAILDGQRHAPLHRLRNFSGTMGLSSIARVVRRRAKKCRDFLRRGSIN